jgi:putative NADH-flavin reductase
MKVTIFGATGMVGSRLVREALAKGFYVKAFGRNVSKLIDADIADERFEAVKGYVFEEDDVYKAIKDSDAVLSALGGDFTGNDKTRSIGIRNIINQMKKADVNRILAVGGLGVLQADEDTLIINSPSYPVQYLAVGKEHREAFNYLKQSNLQWTFICAPMIQDADRNGEYITNANYPPSPDTGHIDAGSLANFMINELEQNHFIKQRVGICNAT